MKACWNVKDWSQSTPFFPLVFTRDIFFMLQSVLHFAELPGDNSKLRKVQGIVQHFIVQTYYIPKQHFSIDKSLIGYEGRAPGMQYLANKHYYCFGFKLFCVCVKVKLGILSILQFRKEKVPTSVNMEYLMIYALSCLAFTWRWLSLI